jgi:hypothetical protein
MSTLSRRRLIAATSATGLAGAALAAGPTPASAATAGTIEFITPFRLQDSRTMEPDKYDTSARDTLFVDGLAGKNGVILNATVIQTEGSGFFRFADDFEDDPTTSNINWYTDGQKVANMAMVQITPPATGITVQGGGAGRAHLIIDVIGFIA